MDSNSKDPPKRTPYKGADPLGIHLSIGGWGQAVGVGFRLSGFADES